MSLEELDIIWKTNPRLESKVNIIKEYIDKTELSKNDKIDLNHMSSLTNVSEMALIRILNIGTEHELFKKIYKYYCGEHKIGELEEVSETLSISCDLCGKTHEFTEEDSKIGYKILFETGNFPVKVVQPKDLENFPIKFGIITALPKEYLAFELMLENPREIIVPGRGAGRRYLLGNVPALNGTHHTLALALAGKGNNIAASRATALLEHFTNIESVIMVGIAGGVPNPNDTEEHVRLGDIVISDEKGVIQYDFDKQTVNETIHRHSPRPPSASLLESVKFLESGALMGKRPWLKHIENGIKKLDINRPHDDTDILVSSTDPGIEIPHPEDINRVNGQPKIFTGPIAAANTLLKNPLKRDSLRDNFGVKAVEMETSGIADATWTHEAGYLTVRGICDYCDGNKNDVWQEYAAIIAAAYTRALLENTPCTVDQ